MRAERNATASWSGYLHQGKVGLLVALRKINELLSPCPDELSCLDDWYIEYETVEDFDIRNKDSVDSRHQVKANVNTSGKKSKYKDALNKFDIKDVPTEQCFLHVVEEILDWDSSGTSIEEAKSCICTYKYPDKNLYCPLPKEDNDPLASFIIDEISSINGRKDTDFNQMIYNYLVQTLDEKIRVEHSKKTDRPGYQCKPQLELKDIYRRCKEENPFVNAEKNKLRESFSNAWTDYKLKLSDSGEEIPMESEIDQIIEEMYCYDWDDFKNLIQEIHPHKNPFGTINIAGFEQVFLDCLFYINANFCKKTIGYRKDGKSYRLTTIVDEDKCMPAVAKYIFENPRLTSLFFEKDYLINKETSEDFPEVLTRAPDYSSLRTEEGNINWSSVDDGDLFHSTKRLKFLSKEDAKEKLND